MINNSADFSRAYSEMLSTHNYRGLVGLLSSTTFNDEASRTTATKLIERFQEQADIEDRLLQGADDRTKSAYNFITSGPSQKELSDANSYSSRFMNEWNELVDDEGNINIYLKDDKMYGAFIASLGKDEAEVRSTKGIQFNKNYGISFKSDAANKIEIFNALKNSGFANYAKFRVDLIDQMSRGEAYMSPSDDMNKDAVYNKINSMMNVVNDASDTYSKLLQNVKPYISEMITTGYMGEDDRQLQQSFSAGLIDLQSFKEMRSILEEKYTRVLQTKSLSQYDVWAMDEDNEGSQVLQPLDDNIRKSELDVEINKAIADNRLHFSHATNGLDIGTMLVIDPEVDKKTGKIASDSKHIRLFVKDLFRSQAENALRDDTQIAAQRQYAKHQTYGHIYRSADGGTISDWNQAGDSAIYTSKNGITQVIDKAQALDIIDNDVIAKRMIEYYTLANKIDKDGNGYTEEYYKVYGANGFNSATMYNSLAAKVAAAMSVKYKGQSEEFIKYKTSEMINSILLGLGVNWDDELNDDNVSKWIDTMYRNKGANVK